MRQIQRFDLQFFADKPDSYTILSQFQGIQTDKKGHILVDEFQNTNIKGIYAVGDVCGKALLTPGNVSSFLG